MKAIRLETFQSTAHFRYPKWFKYRQTYPLPPASTVVGFVHNMCQWTQYHPLQVSISGKYANIDKDYQTMIKGFGNTSIDNPSKDFEERWCEKFNDGDKRYGFVKDPTWVEFLSYLECILHIVPENQNEIEEIYQALKYPPVFPALGRNDDLVDIKKVEIVELSDESIEAETKLNQWLSRKSLEDVLIKDGEEFIGTAWQFAKQYIVVNKRKGNQKRVWIDKQDFFMLTKDTKVNTIVDSDNYPVILI